MTRILVFVLIALAVCLRVWRYRRRRSRVEESQPRARRRSPIDVVNTGVALVAAREVHERVRSRIFRVGTVVMLLGVSAAIAIPALTKSTPKPVQVGVVGRLAAPLRASLLKSASTVGVKVHLVNESSLSQARHQLRTGRLDVAVVNGVQLLVETPFSSSDGSSAAQFVPEAAVNLGIDQALAAAHLSAAQAAILAHVRPVPVHSVHRAAPVSKHQVNPTTIIGVILTFIMLSQYNTWILIGVMEEKSSRVIEVLLSALRPLQLLTGKVVGIGLVAFAQAALIVAVALGLSKAVGSSVIHGSAPLAVTSSLLWLVLGYAFYSWVYAAAGSMAERQDQVQSLAFPLSLPMIFGYVTALTGASTGSPNELVKILAYIPPTAPFDMPVLVGSSAVTWWGFCISVALSLAATVAMARLAAMIYRRAILRTGRRVKYREVFARTAK